MTTTIIGSFANAAASATTRPAARASSVMPDGGRLQRLVDHEPGEDRRRDQADHRQRALRRAPATERERPRGLQRDGTEKERGRDRPDDRHRRNPNSAAAAAAITGTPEGATGMSASVIAAATATVA